MAERGRPLWLIVVPVLGAAAALWASTRVDWGGQTPQSGSALALVALAGLAGVVAVGGWAKRVVGVVVLATGLIAGWPGVTASGTGWGRWLALFGAVSLVVAGVLTIRMAGRLPTLGARYRSVRTRRGAADPDQDMWNGLSEGRDPTTDESPGERRE